MEQGMKDSYPDAKIYITNARGQKGMLLLL